METAVSVSCQLPGCQIRLEGDFDLCSRDLLTWHLQRAVEAGCRIVEVDAGAVTYVDCGSLRILATTRLRLAELGGRLVVVRSSDAFTRVAELAGFELTTGRSRRGRGLRPVQS
jgi:anti-anti-sigma factor